MIDVDLYPFLHRVTRPLAARYEARRRAGMQHFLETVDPEKLESMGKREALKAFRRAAGRTTFYEKVLSEHGVDPRSIRSIEDFARLPILTKDIFHSYPLIDLVRDHHLDDAKSILTSSGFSGLFSFGINMQKNLDNTGRLIDMALNIILDIERYKAMVINCLPMGVKVLTNIMLLAEVGVREDMALALVKKFGPHYERIIIVGEAFFLKFLVEEGIRVGIDWKSLPVSLIAGEDSFPENYRDYMCDLLGVEDTVPTKKFVGSSMGVAELDINLFHETFDTVRLRQLAEQDETFRRALFGDVPHLPMLFHYYPHRTYLEESPEGEVIVTMTSPYLKIPLIRFNAKDRGRVISYRSLERVLGEQGRKDLLPKLHMPLVAVESRASNGLDGFHADTVCHAIFSDSRFPPLLTCHFKLALEGSSMSIRLSLKH